MKGREKIESYHLRCELGWLIVSAAFSFVSGLNYIGHLPPDTRLLIGAAGTILSSALMTSMLVLDRTANGAVLSKEFLLVAMTVCLLNFQSSLKFDTGPVALLSLLVAGGISRIIWNYVGSGDDHQTKRNTHFDFLLVTLLFMTIMTALGLALHFVFWQLGKPKLIESILFFPTTYGAFVGLFLGVATARHVAPFNATDAKEPWRFTRKDLFNLLSVCLFSWIGALLMPHGWVKVHNLRSTGHLNLVSLEIAVAYTVNIAMPLISWLWYTKRGGFDRVITRRWQVLPLCVMGGGLQGYLVSRIRLGSARIDWLTVIVEVCSATAIGFGIVCSFRVLRFLRTQCPLFSRATEPVSMF